MLVAGTAIVLPVFSDSGQNMVAKYVSGNIAVDGSQEESFWSQVPASTVQLAPSNQFGGKETSVSVQVANNGTWLFMFAKWTDPTEDRIQMKVLKGTQTGQYIVNSTYHYADLFFVNWWMGSGSPSQNPFATSQPGKGGQPPNWGSSDKQNIWNWRSYFTDQGSPGYPNVVLWPKMTAPENYSFGPMKGQTIVLPHSWAWDLYMNKTGQYLMDNGMFHSVSCASVTAYPYTVYARGVWSNGAWSLEMARPFTPPAQNQPYTMSFQSGQSHYLSLATSNGGAGEVMATNSISPWTTLSIEAPTSQSLLYNPMVYGSIVGAVVIIAAALFYLRHAKSKKSQATSR